MKDRKLLRVPSKTILLLLLIAALTAGIVFAIIDELYQREERILSSADAVDTFVYDGTTYTLYNAYVRTNQTCILLQSDEMEACLKMPGSMGEWCAEIERFVYVSGRRVCTCDISGKDRTTVFKTRSLTDAKLLGVMEEYAVVCAAKDLGGGASRGVDHCFVLGLETEEVIETDISAALGITPLTITDGWFYYSTCPLDGNSPDMRRCSLNTGVSESTAA